MSHLTRLLLLLAIAGVLGQRKPQLRKPRIISQFRDKVVVEGDTVTFKCQVWGAPKPNVIIVQGRNETDDVESPTVDENDAKPGYNKATLVIEAVTLEDEGAVRCLTRNQKQLTEKVAFLTVKRKCSEPCVLPKICENGKCVCREECADRSVDMLCGSDCKQYMNPCLMENAACRQNRTLTILSRGFCPRIAPPEVFAPRERFQIDGEGEEVTLRVRVEGNPRPVITWYRKDEGGAGLEDGTNTGEVVQEGGTELLVNTTGHYYTIARNCIDRTGRSPIIVVEIRPTAPPTTTPPTGSTSLPSDLVTQSNEVDSDDLTVRNNRRVCTAVRANVITFDGLTFGFSSKCTYVLAMDCMFGGWYVYIRFRPCINDPTIFCFESVQITSSGQQLQLLRGWTINNDGYRHQYERGSPFTVKGMRGYYDGYYLTITLPETGVQVMYDGFSVVHVVLKDAHRGQVCGICGNNDGIRENDVSGGRPKFEPAAEMASFVDSWKLRNREACRNGTTDIVDHEGEWEEGGACGERAVLVENCTKIRGVKDLEGCVDESELLFLENVCKYEACMGEEPLEDFPLVCSMGHAIAERCQGKVGPVSWQQDLMCSTEDERIKSIRSWPKPLD